MPENVKQENYTQSGQQVADTHYENLAIDSMRVSVLVVYFISTSHLSMGNLKVTG